MSAFSEPVSCGLIGAVWSGRSCDWPLIWRTIVTCCDAPVSLATTRLTGPAPKWLGDTDNLPRRIEAVTTSGAGGRGSFLYVLLLPHAAMASGQTQTATQAARRGANTKPLLIPARNPNGSRGCARPGTV